jgi:hypothetical protein
LALEIQPRPIPGTQFDAIPKKGGVELREQSTTPNGDGQWQRQEAMTRNQVGLREQKGSSWDRFNGNRGRQIDFTPAGTEGVGFRNDTRPTTPGQTNAPHNWPQHAALFEERVRDGGEQVGINVGVDLPGGDTSPNQLVVRQASRKNHRRQFRLG